MSDSLPQAAIAYPLRYLQGHTRTGNDSWQRLYSELTNNPSQTVEPLHA